MPVVKKLWGFIKTHKKYWLALILVLLVLLAALFALAMTSPVLAPFIYTGGI